MYQLLQLLDQLVVFSAVLTRWFKNKDRGNILYQWVVPKKQRKKILHHLHDGPLGAHLGEEIALSDYRVPSVVLVVLLFSFLLWCMLPLEML